MAKNENTTISRKTGNDMKKNQGFNQARNERDVSDKGLGFNGQDNGSSQRNTTGMKYSYNQHSGVCNEDRGIEETQMPLRKGAFFGKTAGPATARGPGNPTVEGGRKWAPNAKENFVGNPDKINMGGPSNTKGNLK